MKRVLVIEDDNATRSYVARGLREAGFVVEEAAQGNDGLFLATSAPFDAIAHVLEGEALITIAGVPLTVPAGDLVLLPANQPHAVAARTRFKMLLTMIRPA